MYAAGHGLTEVTKVLLDAGASVLMKDRDGFCPLMYAVTRENKEATRLILHSGADVNTASARGIHHIPAREQSRCIGH
jgi:ankyrin repeat protein